MAKKNNGKVLKIETVRHKDKRKNIPTEELRDFVREEEARPKDVKLLGLLYARDPSLDPQLVWKGKDQQDREELTVPAVPIYIQEKIHPQAIIEDVRAQAKKDKPDAQFTMFDDFNGLPKEFSDRVDFYKWDGNWSNRMILGDSLLSMVSLAEKEGLKGRAQMIYIDPPYGIKFRSNWQVSTRKTQLQEGSAADLTRQPEQIKAFRDTWELGIHSYLAYWRDRLVAARELLTETGSVFVQISEENVHLVRCMMDEVYGSDNFISLVSYATTGGFETVALSRLGDYILWYAKNKTNLKYRQLYLEKSSDTLKSGDYRYVQKPDGTVSLIDSDDRDNITGLDASDRVFRLDNVTSQDSPSEAQPFKINGTVYHARAGRHWTANWPDGMRRLRLAERIFARDNSLAYIRYLDDYPVLELTNFWGDTSVAGSAAGKWYVVQTNPKVIERCMLMSTDPGDLVLDPTCGSGTTAYVAEQWGRRWITIDTSRVAVALARTRLMTGRFPYYLPSDSPEGVKKEAEITGQVPPPYQTGGDIKKGFVYKRVPHVTLKAIANNEEIDPISEKWQVKLEPMLAELNKLVKEKFEEWQVPREAEKTWPAKAKELLAEWWENRRMRQREIDASIARRAEMELLYDQPYEDNKRIRVTGPFTMESLSPHRTINIEEKKQLAKPNEDGWAMKLVGAPGFGSIIIDNLRKAGVQNTIKNERLKFDRLDIHPGAWVHAVGEYTEKDGKSRRVAVCIGPEHGTVGPELVKEAAKEAVQGVGFDLLIVCGFAFDPHVSEEAKRYGKLTVLPAKINPDLQMGTEFLKKTGAANLFTVFGEPDIEVKSQKDGKVVVEVKGVDVYDPTTGEIRSHTTDDIACWFIDTNYNGESFFVRHAYFTGADQPYDKLKRVLRAEIDEAAWSMLYSTVSRPFDKPETGKIAVKVINHYGDEVLKVYEVKK